MYILWEKRKFGPIIKYFIGVGLPLIVMVLYLISIGVLNDFIYWTIIFNLTVFAQHGTSTPSTLGFITRIVFVYTMSMMAFLHKDRKLIIILAIFLIGSLVSIFDRADFVHLQPSLPFVLLATSLGIFSIKRKNIQIGFILAYSFIAIWWQNIFYKGHLSDKVFFFDEQTKLIAQKIKSYTKNGEKIFILGAPLHLYQMTQTLPVGDVFVFQFPWFLKVAEDRILEGVSKDKPNIVVSEQSITDFAKDIDQYINKNYQVIDRVGTTDILRRKTF